MAEVTDRQKNNFIDATKSNEPFNLGRELQQKP
jgi:hypothetical protein